MYFYRQKDEDGKLLAYLACETKQSDENAEEISEAEYNAAIDALQTDETKGGS